MNDTRVKRRPRTVTIQSSESYYYHKCPSCGEEWYSQPSLVRSNCYFCSAEIRPEVRISVSNKYISWKRYSRLTLERDNRRCQLCGSLYFLQVHHIDYDFTNVDEYNLITLCSSCNTKANFNKDHWLDYYTELVKSKPSIRREAEELGIYRGMKPRWMST